MSVKLKLSLSIAGLSFIIVAMFLATWLTTNQQKSDGLVINLAGRQRMLSQKMCKEILGFEIKRQQTGSIDMALAATIKNTVAVFDATLTALRNGGDAPVEPNMKTTTFKKIPAAQGDAASQLTEVNRIWQQFKPHVETIIASDQPQSEHIAFVSINNIPLLKAMHKAVGTLQKQSEGRVTTLLIRQLVGIVFGVAAMLFAIITILNIIKRLNNIAAFADQLGRGNLTATSKVSGQDELGIIGAKLDKMTVRLHTMVRQITDNAGDLNHEADNVMDIATNIFSQSSMVEEKSQSVSAAAEEMSVTMSNVSDSSTTINSQMNQIAELARSSSDNIGTIANATDELNSTVSEIASNTEKARTVSSNAVANVQNATSRVDELGVAAHDISKVIDVIMEIAEQTKLLALNATIEAARAGEAGKGFAVVANEVKELASQTNKATQEIREKVGTMQTSTDNTIHEITQINSVINEINEIIVTIAGAVEEQSVTTQDIAHNIGGALDGITHMANSTESANDSVGQITDNVSQAAIAASEVATSITDVTSSTGEIHKEGGQLKAESDKLSTLSTNLQSMVSQFTL